LADRSGEIMAALLDRAAAGEAVALRLAVERLVPIKAARDRAVAVELAALQRAEDVVEAGAAIIGAVAGGSMTLSEGREFMGLLETQRRILETADLAVRLEAIERASAPKLDGERFEAELARQLGARVRSVEPGRRGGKR
jgi:hypothetical protein